VIFQQKLILKRQYDFSVDGNELRQAMSHYNTGIYQSKQYEFKSAIKSLTMAMQIREEILGINHQDTALVYNSIGNIYFRMCEYNNSLLFYQKAFKVREEVLGKEHPETATTYDCIGEVYRNQGEYEKALEYYKQVMAIFEKSFGNKEGNLFFIIA